MTSMDGRSRTETGSEAVSTPDRRGPERKRIVKQDKKRYNVPSDFARIKYEEAEQKWWMKY